MGEIPLSASGISKRRLVKELECYVRWHAATYRRPVGAGELGWEMWRLIQGMPATRPNSKYYRDIYEQRYGPIPTGKRVHHVDGDPLNNEVENLEAVTSQEHGKKHRGKARV